MLRSADLFGHQVGVNYKGKEFYNTIFGGVVSLSVCLLTLVLAINTTIELILMNDPTVTEYLKPLSSEDRSALIPVSGSDYDFVFAIEIVVKDDDGNETANPVIPSDIGKLTVEINGTDEGEQT